jgi:ankyrin repeat protein
MSFLRFEYICTEHHTSKAQYEYQLKKWGIRKYRKRERPRVHLDPDQRCLSAATAVTSLRDPSIQDLAPHRSLASNIDRSGAPNRGNAQYLFNLIFSIDNLVARTPQIFGAIASMASPPYHVTLTPTQFRPNTPSMTWFSSLDGLVIPESSSSGASNIHMSDFAILFPHPFSWIRALDWSSIKTFIKDNEAIIRYPDAQSMKLTALSYQTNPISTICATSNTTTNFAQYLVSALLNNMEAPSSSNPDGIYSWVGKLPQSVIRQFLKALPPGHSDALRERIFVTAMNTHDAATIQSALESGFDIHQVIDFGAYTGPELPLVRASRLCSYPVARTIVTHACLLVHTHQLDNILDQLIRGFETHDSFDRNHRHNKCFAFKWSELVHILLDAGAKFTTRCLKVAVEDDIKPFRRILDYRDGQVWMEANILLECLQWKSRSNPQGMMAEFDMHLRIRLIYSYILEEKIDDIQSHNPASTDALRKAFRCAIQQRYVWAVNMILAAALHLGIALGSPTHDDLINASMVSAHRDSDWELLIKLTQECETEAEEITQQNAQRLPEDQGILACESLISDWDVLLHRLHNYGLYKPAASKYDILRFLASGCSPDFDSILVALVLKLDRENSLLAGGVINLLLRARVTAISQLVSQQEYWSHTSLCPRTQHDFDALDDLIYRKRTDSPFFRNLLRVYESEDEHYVPTVLRAFSYYAIDTNNDMLLRWLLKEEYFVGKAGQQWGSYPSLLAVAASQNNAHMTQVLLDEGVESKDSRALMWAIAVNADNTVIEMLLAAVGQVQCKRNYGGAALRMAIHRKDYRMLLLLSTAVDVNSIEPLDIESSENWQELKPLSPLCEAIYSRDLKAAEILIKNRANVDGLVTRAPDRFYKHYGHLNTRVTAMERVSALLAAIDTENLAMVKLLAENGADTNHSFRTGLVRRPLQRAAEIGNFEIVQYLLERGAPADCTPCYSGGTPLQLTAIGGYVGIAELLLEHGANVNYPPAEGYGRTAFEGAAEWGRVDMMSLLVSRGLNFDLVVNVNGQTQYERAMELAERRGYMAIKRFVERLRVESGFDVINLQAVMGG